MESRYSERHHEDVAAIIGGAARYSGKDNDGQYFVSIDPDEVEQAFARLFAADNPVLFNRERFIKTCAA